MGQLGMMGMMDWMGRWWDWGGRMLAPAGTGATEQERHHWLLRGSALCEVVVATNIVGAEYLCRISKTIHIECTQIRTSNVVQDSISVCTILLYYGYT